MTQPPKQARSMVALVQERAFEMTLVGHPEAMLFLKTEAGKVYLSDSHVARLCEVLPQIFPHHFEARTA